MTAEAPAGGRPGTAYFAPGVRIRKLARELRAGSEPGDDLPHDVSGDVTRVEVTRVHTGAAQYSVTLNNWYMSTAADRRSSENDATRRELGGRARPLWPRFKYNAFDLLAFGDRLRIDLRYWPETSSRDGGGPVDAREWVPMVAGPVTDMRFSFGAEAATVVITGEDDLSRLKDRNRDRHEFGRVAEKDLVRRVLDRAEYPLPLAEGAGVAWPPFATGSGAPAEALGENQAYIDYLQKLADRLDCEVFIEFADLGDADGGLAFHFEPSRSRLAPDRSSADTYRLSRDVNLIDYSPSIRVLDMPTDANVTGRHHDAKRPERVRSPADASILADELHVDPSRGDAELTPGPDVRKRFFPGRENPMTQSNATNVDAERALEIAKTQLRKQARGFMTIDATTIGLPRLRPGVHVEVRGMRPPFDGFFYVTKTVHSVGPDGFRTKVSARRPGMPLPPYEER